MSIADIHKELVQLRTHVTEIRNIIKQLTKERGLKIPGINS